MCSKSNRKKFLAILEGKDVFYGMTHTECAAEQSRHFNRERYLRWLLRRQMSVERLAITTAEAMDLFHYNIRHFKLFSRVQQLNIVCQKDISPPNLNISYILLEKISTLVPMAKHVLFKNCGFVAYIVPTTKFSFRHLISLELNDCCIGGHLLVEIIKSSFKTLECITLLNCIVANYGNQEDPQDKTKFDVLINSLYENCPLLTDLNLNCLDSRMYSYCSLLTTAVLCKRLTSLKIRCDLN